MFCGNGKKRSLCPIVRRLITCNQKLGVFFYCYFGTYPSCQYLSSSIYNIYWTGIGSTAGFVLGNILKQTGLSSMCLSNESLQIMPDPIYGRSFTDRLWLWMRHSFRPLCLLYDLRRTLESCYYAMLLYFQRIPSLESS